ncbi:MAG: SpoVA/SpoVAEb family sporulation membrane protein [Bacilli bacterium]|nr:SpoVA/SpoVAEb family sporulation membrane protein [Bacilli bacterium]
MILFFSFIVCGLICLIGQIIYDNTKLTAGHITSLFVVLGGALEAFGIYDKLIEIAGAGALLPITSFGHSLTHAAIEGVKADGLIGAFAHTFDLTSSGVAFAIFLALIAGLIFRPRT